MFLSNWLMITRIVAASVVTGVDYPTPEDFFLAFDGTNTLFTYGGSNPYASNLSIYFDGYKHDTGNVYPVVISEPGNYKALVDVCGDTYLTDAVTVSEVAEFVPTVVTLTSPPILSKTYLNSGTSTNTVNTSTSGTEVPLFSNNSQYPNINIGGFTFPDVYSIVAPETGYYNLSFNIYFQASNRDVTVGVKPIVEDVDYDEISASDYIANAGGHTTASTSMTTIIHLNGNKKVGLKFFRVGNTNTVSILPGAFLSLEKIENPTMLYKQYITNTNDNLNDTLRQLDIFDLAPTTTPIDIGGFQIINNNTIVAPETGYYRMNFNIFYNGDNDRISVGVIPFIEDTDYDEISASGFVLDRNDQISTTTSMTTIIHLTGNRNVSLKFFQNGNSGSSYFLPGSFISLEKIENPTKLYKVYVNVNDVDVNTDTEIQENMFDPNTITYLNIGNFPLPTVNTIVAPETGYYILNFNFYMRSSATQDTDVSVSVRPFIEDIDYDEISASAFIADISSHFTASTSMSTIIHLTGNRNVSFKFKRIGKEDTVSLESSSFISLEKIGLPYTENVYAQLYHDGLDKLTVANTSNANTETNLRLGSNVWDIGGLRTVYICKPGDYKSFTVDPDGQMAHFGNVTVNSVTITDPTSLSYDGYNKLTVVGEDAQTLYEGSNSYALGTASNVYITNPAEYTYFTRTAEYALLSNVIVEAVTSHPTDAPPPNLTYNDIDKLIITGAEAGAYITWLSDDGKKLGCGVDLVEYIVFEPGVYKAEVSGATTFTFTNTVAVT